MANNLNNLNTKKEIKKKIPNIIIPEFKESCEIVTDKVKSNLKQINNIPINMNVNKNKTKPKL